MLPRTPVSPTRIVTALTAAAVLAVLVGCGGSSDKKYSEAELQAATKQAAQQQHMKDIQRQQAKDQARLQKELNDLKKKKSSSTTTVVTGGGGGNGGSGGGGSSSGTVSCGDGVSYTGPTNCPFAGNIASAFRSSGPGDVVAYSDATKRDYYMTCTSGGVCSGGNTTGNPVIYVRN